MPFLLVVDIVPHAPGGKIVVDWPIPEKFSVLSLVAALPFIVVYTVAIAGIKFKHILTQRQTARSVIIRNG